MTAAHALAVVAALNALGIGLILLALAHIDRERMTP